MSNRIGRPRHSGETSDARAVILEWAARGFRWWGFYATSTTWLAAKAGMRQSSFFSYFPTKEKLLETLVVEQGFVPIEMEIRTRYAPADNAPLPVDRALVEIMSGESRRPKRPE